MLRDLYVGEMTVLALVSVMVLELYMSTKLRHGQLVRVSSRMPQTVILNLVILYRLMVSLIYMI